MNMETSSPVGRITGGEKCSKARFPLGEFVRAKRLFPLSASLITSANAMPTKEKVASREKSRLVENGLNVENLKCLSRHAVIIRAASA